MSSSGQEQGRPEYNSVTQAEQRGQRGKGRFPLRWAVAALLFCVTTLNYGNRATLAVAGPAMAESLGLDPVRMGHLFAAFAWAYVLGQLPGGWLLDRYGSRRVYFGSIFCWSLFTCLQGLAGFLHGQSAYLALYILCFLVGLSSAPSFPGNSRMAAAWFPVGERATAVTAINAALYFATALFAPLMALCIGLLSWPGAFVLMGGLGFAACLWWLRLAYPPAAHPRLCPEELRYIEQGGALVRLDMPEDAGAAGTVSRSTPTAWKAMGLLMRSRMMLGVYMGQYCINALTVFFVTWFPLYLIQARGVDLVTAGMWTALPALCGGVGGILGGVTSDWLMRRTGSLTLARKAPILAGLTVALSLLGCLWVESVTAAASCMALAFFGKGFGSLGWTVLADTAPRQITGLAGGVFNMFGNLSGVVTPIAIGYIVASSGSFDLAIWLVAAHAALGLICFGFVAGRIERMTMPGESKVQA